MVLFLDLKKCNIEIFISGEIFLIYVYYGSGYWEMVVNWIILNCDF